jgi:uncharacterized protein (DUF2252 family)
VKRLATSLEVAARENRFSHKRRRAVVRAAVAQYRSAMRVFAGMGSNLDVWYARADMEDLRREFDSQLKARQHKMVDKGLAKAQTRDSMQEVAKLTRVVDGRPRIISDPPLLVPVDELLPSTDYASFEAQIRRLLTQYRRTLETDRRFLLETYAFADMARKVVGVGSVGTRCWIILLLGQDTSDPLFSRSKRPRIRCSAASWGPASTPTRGSGSSRVSG